MSPTMPDIVLVPRTPTPPPFAGPEDESNTPVYQHPGGAASGLGFALSQTTSAQSDIVYDPNSLSPVRSKGSAVATPSTAYYTPNPGVDGYDNGPFNFQPTSMAKSPVVKSNIGQRRGHKYKHSSVSHQIFLEPPARAPLALPNSLPIPTFSECRASMTVDQKVRFYWSISHMLVAGYTAWNAHSSAAMEALSHLIFYDGLGALLCVFVEVWSNFEVWGRSSLRHPFGLQRMEVIAGFALSVLLIFFGFDLISHNAKHALEGLGNHVPHHTHQHERVSAGTVDFTALLAIGSTLISAVGLKNHARIGKAMRFAAMENLPSILSNPSHLLTLSCSTVILLLPLLSLHTFEYIDKAISLSIAVAMLFLGFHLGMNVGRMLLMSYPGRGVSEVIHDIETDPLVTGVQQAKFWQAHYGVGIANLRLRVRGTEEGLARLREKITSLIRNRLSGGYGTGSGGQKWEVSVEFEVEQNSGISHSHAHVHAHEFH